MAPDRRREQLLDTALEIALDRGFHAVTIDGVARAAGVTRPVVYGLFDDRGALLAALVERSEQRALAQLAPALPGVPGPDDEVAPDALLVAGVRAYLTAVAADPATWRVVLLPPEGAPAELTDRMNAQQRVVLGALRELVEWGLARLGQDHLDADLFARGVITLAEGAARLHLQAPDRYPVERFAGFTEQLLSGLLPPAAAPEER